ncbi:MAG TPA: ATP synthase F1 subunit gamma, partial [Patescibacteria group bacterium]|nr:ATP synthase F1 subunit gamma [Patescibacteria group bacterium]
GIQERIYEIMATLLSLKRRMKAAQNVSKTTKAMQMIATSKLKKAQEAALTSRPYVTKLTELTQAISLQTPEAHKHPYMLLHKDAHGTLLLALAPDKGLCGGLITNLIKEFFLNAHASEHTTLIIMGKKLENQAVRVNRDIIASFNFGTKLPPFSSVFPLVRLINDYYLTGKVQSVKVLYTDFSNLFTQKPKVLQLLPIALPDAETIKADELTLYEPSLPELVPSLLTHYLEMSLYQLLLESFLSEQAARMIAMQNATNNAKDIIEELRLEYNKTRQTKITSELLDIVGGRSMHA